MTKIFPRDSGYVQTVTGRRKRFGCGTGYWLAALRTVCPRIYGLDYSLEMLHWTRDRKSASA